MTGVRATLYRLWTFLGLRGAFLLVVVTVALAGGASLSGNVQLVAVYILVLDASPAALLTYRRSARSRPQEEIVPELPAARHQYCVMLRSFGHDGRIVIPQQRKGDGLVELMEGFVALNSTLEQELGIVARLRSLDCLAIVDQRTTVAPPGVTFLQSSNEDWQDVARALIADAHTIFLVLGSRGTTRGGFSWEVDQVAAVGVADRAVVVLPPPDGNQQLYARARGDACAVLAALSGGAQDAEFFDALMPATAFAAQVVAGTPYPRWWRSEWSTPKRAGAAGYRRTGDVTYAMALTEALLGNTDGFTEDWYVDDLEDFDTVQSRPIRTSGPDPTSTTGLLYNIGWRRALIRLSRQFLTALLSIRGRATRTEFWTVSLFGAFVATFTLGVMQAALGDRPVALWLFGAAALVPVVTVGVRRLHDLDRTGW